MAGLSITIASLSMSHTSPRRPEVVCATQALALTGIIVNVVAAAYADFAVTAKRARMVLVSKALVIAGSVLPVAALIALYFGTQSLQSI